ncbi:LysR family transcriptional regulator [Wenyingzhuangia sp. IMCC45467]
MEIKYFKLIKTIVEEGSLVNATEKLFLTQSALSHQLKEMELQLGFKVFIRKRNQWELTAEGKELYHLGNTIIDNIEKGLSDIKKIQLGSSGTIKVSTECYSFYHGLPSFIQNMGRLYPDIKVDLRLEATHHPIEKLQSNDIDIALVTLKPNDKNLHCIPFFEDEILALMHEENFLNKKDIIIPKDLEQQHLIIHSYPLETVSVYQQWLKPNQTIPEKISAVPLTQVALEMIEANIGITCMPLWALKLFNIPTNIVFKKLGKSGLKRTHYLVVRKEDRHKKYIHDFILNFHEQFSAM